MRKPILSIVSVAAIIVAALAINSCNKQDELKQTNINKNDEARIVFQKVTKFIDKVKYIKENPDFKSGEEVSVDSALWYLNAGFNFEMSAPDNVYNAFYVDSSLVLLPVGQEGLVHFNDIMTAYSLIEDTMNMILSDAPFDEKDKKFTFIEVKSVDNSNILLKNTTIIGEKGIDPGSDYPPFEEGNNWIYGNNLGKCDDPTLYYDAGDTLRDIINSRRPIYIHDEGHIVIYSNPVTITHINGNHIAFYNGTNTNNYNFLLFYVNENNCPPENPDCLDDYWYCLEYDELNNYYYSTSEAIYDVIPNSQQYWPEAYEKTFMHLDTLYGHNYQINQKEHRVHDIKYIHYAKRHVYDPGE